ncbi:MAG: hypothetical protein BWY57_02298 [Betaproteobacteria bacterium ADurb.Bin341]|nr:MAG: hypothetical protein BWY57_02298 [Betaproteobacteria bacterium ADurb.Bin341]
MKTTPLKVILREQCLPELKARCAYFDVVTLRAWLKNKRIPYKSATLNRYMTELTDAGFVWSAGPAGTASYRPRSTSMPNL